MDSPALDANYLHILFRDAVAAAHAQEHHILTAGESEIVQRYMALPPDAGALYARLHGRVGRVFRVDTISYISVASPSTAAQSLYRWGLARPRAQLSDLQVLAAHTVAELRDVARASGISDKGNRPALVDRLAASGVRSALPGDCLQLRHTALFRRLLRAYTGNHQGDLTPLILDLIGVRRAAQYEPSGGQTLWGCRAALLAYEDALSIYGAKPSESGWAELAPALLGALETSSSTHPGRPPFCARTLNARLARRAVRAVERCAGPQAALPMYRRLLERAPEHHKALSVRMAMCLGRLGEAQAGAKLCAAARGPHATSADDIALERTGRRLSRSSDSTWSASAPLLSAPTREWPLPMVQRHPPRFLAAEGELAVEAAVASSLRQAGHEAIRGEAAPWTTLFGLLFRDAIFAPIPHMLPTTLMRGPLDLRTPDFYEPRRSLIDPVLAQIANGDAPKLLCRALHDHAGESISGVHWNLLTPQAWRSLLHRLGPDLLVRLMSYIAENPARAWSGMPDLLVVPGASDKELHEPLLVEVKAPGDSMRDNQRCRHHSLLKAGIPVEVWKVVDQPSCYQ